MKAKYNTELALSELWIYCTFSKRFAPPFLITDEKGPIMDPACKCAVLINLKGQVHSPCSLYPRTQNEISLRHTLSVGASFFRNLLEPCTWHLSFTQAHHQEEEGCSQAPREANKIPTLQQPAEMSAFLQVNSVCSVPSVECFTNTVPYPWEGG